ncbi:MAG: BRO family protein [Bacillota bacterium]|nr:BRO family protein [Bacillota bacterium]
MSDLQVFKNEEFGEIRTTIVNGEPMFCLVDVCKALSLEQPSRVKARLKEDGVTISKVIDRLGREQEATFINEANLYKTIFQSRKESAERFTDWVTSEVLPSIRKYGMYATDNVIDNILNNPDFAIGLLTKLREESAARKEAERRNAILTHVNKTYTMTEIAKELNMKSATRLNRLLAEKKIQYQVNGTWVMYSKYSDLGYEEIKQEVLDSGRVIYYRRITQMGREFILKLFSDKVA